MKKTKKIDITQKTINMQNFPFFMELQHMSCLWTKHICIESPLKHLPIFNTLTSSVMTPEFVLLPSVSHFQHWWRSHVTSYVIAYKSLLLCKFCCWCHFCVVFLFKGCYHLSQFLYISLNLSYESNLSYQCWYDLCPNLISSFWFSARVGWCGKHQCPPSNCLTPSNSTHYLGLRLETYIVPWGLQSLVVGCSSL